MIEQDEGNSTDSIWDRLRQHREQMQSVATVQSTADGLAERMARRAEILRKQPVRSDEGSDRIDILAFSKMKERYGIPLEEIASVESLEHFTTVPCVPDFVRGVTPWRGYILSLIDLGRFFGQQDTALADLNAYLVVESGGRRIAVVARDVEGIINVPANEIVPAPDLPAEISMDWISGVYGENRLILKVKEIIESVADFCVPSD